jgi:hypothetical protein
MKIRSITYFCNPKYPLDEKALQKAGTFLNEAKSDYEAAGYEDFPFLPCIFYV